MHQNIRTLYLLNFLNGIVFWYPIEKLYLLSIHIEPVGISINAIVFLIILVVFDVPAGVLADKWKRKYTLLLSLVALILSSIVGGLSNNLVEYLPMTVLLGAFVVLTQGTFQAMMYDSLRDSGHESTYDKHQGRSYALFLAGLGVSSLAGGYMANTFGYRSTYFATAVTMIIALLVTFTLSEPKSHKPQADHKLKEHIQTSLKQFFASRLLFQLSLLITAASILRSAQNEYAGLFFTALGLTAIPIGYATAGKWLFSSLGQVAAPRIGRKALQLVPLFFITFTIFSLIHSRWSLVFFYIAGFLFSVITNQAEAAVQDITPSEVRATMLSLLTFTSNLILVPLSLLFGWIAQHSNVFNAYLMIAGVGLLYLIAWLFMGRPTLQYHISNKKQLPSIEAELA